MATIFWSTPSTPRPPAQTNPWTSVQMTWTGTDGTSWDLSRWQNGVLLLAGTRGLSRIDSTRFLSESAGTHGSRFRGQRFPEREVFWPVSVAQGDGTQAWLDFDRAFWASLNPRGTGVWRVTQPDGTWRELTCRPVGDGGHTWEKAPGLRYWTNYGVYLVAEDPFWYGPEIKSPLWTSAAPVDFIPAEGGPPYHPGSATTIDSATLTNPGDESAWPTWTVTGPVDSVQVTLDGQSIGYGELIEGDVLVIDTENRRATLNGEVVTGQLSTFNFAPIPPGGTVPLDIVMTGGGTLQASFRPRHDRAW